jgi:sugar lactone lactonase YvrE
MRIDLSQVKTIGSGLNRPEGVMAFDDGGLAAADGLGRVAIIGPDGATTFHGHVGGAPNGICIDDAGNVVIANIGNGQVQVLAPDGRHRILLTEADGERITSPNFPFIDSKRRLWVSNSTARPDMQKAIEQPAPDGAIVLYEQGQARIAARELWFANGVALDQDEKFIYVAETMTRRVVRFGIAADGQLSNREIYGPDPLGDLGFPDGIAFDEAGNLWITFPAWNAVGYIAPNRELVMALEDPERKALQRPTNICFGGPDRRTAYIGSLNGASIPYFQAPHPGMKLIHQS